MSYDIQRQQLDISEWDLQEKLPGCTTYVQGNRFILVKPSQGDITKLVNPDAWTDLEKKTSRIRHACGICEEGLPVYTLENMVYIWVTSEGGNKAAVRETEHIKNVKPLSELTFYEIVKDSELCAALFEISNFTFDQLISYRRRFDIFRGESGWPFSNVLERAIISIRSVNIFIGDDDDNNKVIFIDPDWYTNLSEYVHPKLYEIYGGIEIITNLIFYGFLSKVHEVIDLRKNVFDKPFEL